ncbi:periplasmic thioredoxin of cytochrome c-type biogenesis [Psychromonas sp. 14N.309.X.WAT.B.A12]|uniref:periplasmic thioredoxin of cytochrome c-type biogenesis n=1 Tax=unclassified Psychromonas TaxID=2614957 RepID=UPI0025AFCFA2|nr:periplasmic thioredoxin of cytochrome c-type biogenesis [Psychromonas sp. 14N.309.X.WAT.B.A12]MDN2662069.1 periplasmic thioredoxin of cytochrome c-type biogenesis [Psychromonas sp. 14N.309.X.WAT.B.A12]
MPNPITVIKPNMFYEKIEQQHSFVLNVVASWCSDCTQQQENINRLVDTLDAKLAVFQLVAQKTKGAFIDQQHQDLVDELGGHGYPRTVLVIAGKVLSTDNVEVIKQQDLINLANKFNALLSA